MQRLRPLSEAECYARLYGPSGESYVTVIDIPRRIRSDSLFGVNGEDLRLIHLPHGHTDSDCIVVFTKSNVVHMGDDFVLAMFPFIDRDNGGSIKGLIANLDAVMPTIDPGAKIIPGHGGLADKPALEGYRDMLKGTVAIMNEAIQNGKTLEQVKSEKTLAAWSNYVTDFVTLESYEETLYNELKPAASPTK